MKKDVNKIVFFTLCAALVFGCGILVGRLLYNILNQNRVHYCLVRPMVYDAFTGKPIPNATVYNATDGRGYTTDSSGSTDWISVHYNEPDEITLNAFVASADGYKSTLLYMVCQTALEPLDGPLIYMFSGQESDTVSMVYSPSDDYSKALADRLRQTGQSPRR